LAGVGTLAASVLVLSTWIAARTALAAQGPSLLTYDVAADPNTGLGEPEIKVNPRDPTDLVVGENNSGVSVSHDRGLTWTQRPMSNPGDNVLAVEPDGTFVYSSLDGQVHASSDGGDSWTTVGNWVGAVAAQTQALAGAPLGAVVSRELGCDSPEPGGPVSAAPGESPGPHLIGCDRPWMAADAQTGKLYVSFADHDDNSGGTSGLWELAWLGCKPTVLVNPAFECGRQYVSSSTDGGRTWSSFHPMDSSDYPAGGTGGFSSGPVAAHGVLATAYVASQVPGSTCNDCVVFETSTDGGAGWTRHRVPASVTPSSILTTDATTLFEPYTAADPSRPGRYAVMAFDATQTHLLVYVTDDSGGSWLGPAVLAEPGGQKRYDPWIAFGPTGALGAIWRTGYSDGTYAVWAAVSPAGDTDFAPPVRLSSQPSPGPVNQLAGDDASSVTLDGQYLHAAWGDRRTGQLGIRYGRYHYAADPAVRAILAGHQR
jgi:hypothetical protein